MKNEAGVLVTEIGGAQASPRCDPLLGKLSKENDHHLFICSSLSTIHHGNPQPSFLGVITHILGVQNLHFSWLWGPKAVTNQNDCDLNSSFDDCDLDLSLSLREKNPEVACYTIILIVYTGVMTKSGDNPK